MFWHRKNIVDNEEYRLVSNVEAARKGLIQLQTWGIVERDALEPRIPSILAEVRYRFLLNQARKRRVVNRWYNESLISED